MICKIWITLYTKIGSYKLNWYTAALELKKIFRLFLLNITACVEVTGWFNVKSHTKATTLFFIVEMFEKLLLSI